MKQKDNHWFAHDKNAMNDPKLMSLKAVYGMKGYGIWWALMEVLRSSEGYRYSLTDEFAYTHLSRLLEEMTPDEVCKFIDDCINRFKLLKLKNGNIYHEEMTEQLRALDRKRKLMSDSGKKSAAKRKQIALNNNELCNPVETTLQLPCNKERTLEDSTEHKSIAHNNTVQDAVVDFVVDDKKAINHIGNNTQAVHTQKQTYTHEVLLQRSLDDDDFSIQTEGVKRISHQQLHDWLAAFNKWLRYTAEPDKTDTEYRKHFRNWLTHRDLKVENPLTYNPAADAQKPKGKYALPPAPTYPSAKEALKLHRQQMEESRIKDRELAIARGKIKPDDIAHAG